MLSVGELYHNTFSFLSCFSIFLVAVLSLRVILFTLEYGWDRISKCSGVKNR